MLEKPWNRVKSRGQTVGSPSMWECGPCSGTASSNAGACCSCPDFASGTRPPPCHKRTTPSHTSSLCQLWAEETGMAQYLSLPETAYGVGWGGVLKSTQGPCSSLLNCSPVPKQLLWLHGERVFHLPVFLLFTCFTSIP